MTKNVVAIVSENTGAFSLGVATEFFGYNSGHLGVLRFDFALVAERPGLVRTHNEDSSR